MVAGTHLPRKHRPHRLSPFSSSSATVSSQVIQNPSAMTGIQPNSSRSVTDIHLKRGASLAARSLAMPGTQRAAASQQPLYHGSSAQLGRLSLKTWQGKKGKHFMRFMFSRQGPLFSDLRPQSSRELKNTVKNKGSCSFAYNEILTCKNTRLERGAGFHLRY